MNYSDMGQRIRFLRKAQGMTQYQLAAKVGLSGPFIGLIERGERYPSLETFVRIANALRTDANMLLEASLIFSSDKPQD